MSKNNQFPRGAEWRQWDLHIHTPASYHWQGQRFESDTNSSVNKKLVDEMIAAINASTAAVFAIMDYWTFDGWFALNKRLKESDAPKLNKTVFPGIELRLTTPTDKRLNAHVIFSDKISDQLLIEFKSNLKVEVDGKDRPLSDQVLIDYARSIKKGVLSDSEMSSVASSNSYALRVGSQKAVVLCKSYIKAIQTIPDRQAIGFMPFNTYNGLNEVICCKEDYDYALKLFNSALIFEDRNQDMHAAFSGTKTVGNEKIFENFQDWLGGIPRLVVSGSDAHRFIGAKDERGYGDFPSDKITWIKADPTFRGLLQAIKEPSKRSYIGEKPDKLRIVEENRTFFIDELIISKENPETSIEKWFDGVKIPLNSDLVAIIGEKGSGKSAIADIIALLGNSHQHVRFSFLNENRFRRKRDNLAKNFSAELKWKGGATNNQNLDKNPDEGSVEKIRYLPQSYFENLCNENTDDGHKNFQMELEKVIFNHLDDSARLEAPDFKELVDCQEKTFRNQLDEYRKNLSRINLDIQDLEEKFQGSSKKELEELLKLKKTQIAEHDKIKPEALPKPSEVPSSGQEDANNHIEKNKEEFLKISADKKTRSENLSLITKQLNAIRDITNDFQILIGQYKSFQESNSTNFETLGLKLNMIVRLDDSNFEELSSKKATLELSSKKATLEQKKEKLQNDCAELEEKLLELTSKQEDLKKKLNEPQLLYQKNCEDIKRWEEARNNLFGPKNSMANKETLYGLEASIAELNKIPEQLITKREKRLKLAEQIFNALDAMREAREKLFKPLQESIESNQLIIKNNKLKFQSNLRISLDALVNKLFEIIVQHSGDFNKDKDGRYAIKELSESISFNSKDGVLEFVQKLYNMICGNNESFSYRDLRKNKTLSEVYDLVFGLSYLEPKYSLLFEETEISQLSPGQRGALLLIFYLLVDKGQRPIVLDQPEENLDNKTVFSLLAPVIIEAKKQRQIIMVTHNPNLAIVCDAEQIIHSSFDRKTMKASYESGSIENPTLNKHAVNVLEGTKPAFDDRKDKYH